MSPSFKNFLRVISISHPPGSLFLRNATFRQALRATMIATKKIASAPTGWSAATTVSYELAVAYCIAVRPSNPAGSRDLRCKVRFFGFV